jgi:cell division FtsZ-interacting protein ZapD
MFMYCAAFAVAPLLESPILSIIREALPVTGCSYLVDSPALVVWFHTMVRVGGFSYWKCV